GPLGAPARGLRARGTRSGTRGLERRERAARGVPRLGGDPRGDRRGAPVRRLAAVAVVTLAFAGATTSASAAPSSIVRAQLTLPTGPYRFGEQIAPTVDVLVDTKLADPKAMQVETRFFPYQAIGAPRRTVTRDGSVADVRYRYVLACPT